MSVANDLESWKERVGGAAVLLSLLIHALLSVLMFTDVLIDHQARQLPTQPEAVEVSLVPEPKRQPPQPQPPPPPKEEVQPQPDPVPQAAASQPPPPKPVPKPQQVVVPYKPPPKPVLEEGKIAKESKAPKHNWLDDAPDDMPKESRTVTPFAKSSEPMAWSKGAARAETEGAATQTERDYLLSQVVKHWRNRPVVDWPPDAVVHLRINVLPDGHLAAPFNALEHYTPELAIVDFANMPRGDPRKAVLESLYVALRIAQPFILTPELRAKAPFETILDFRLVDIP